MYSTICVRCCRRLCLSVCVRCMYAHWSFWSCFFRKSIHFWQRYAQKNNSYIFVLSNLVNQSYYSILFNGCSAIYVLWLYCIVLSELYIESWCCTVYCTCNATLLSLWCLWCTLFLFSLPCHIIFTEHSLIKQEACQWVLCFSGTLPIVLICGILCYSQKPSEWLRFHIGRWCKLVRCRLIISGTKLAV